MTSIYIILHHATFTFVSNSFAIRPTVFPLSPGMAGGLPLLEEHKLPEWGKALADFVAGQQIGWEQPRFAAEKKRSGSFLVDVERW